MEKQWKLPNQLKQGKYDDAKNVFESSREIIYGLGADGRVSRPTEETQKWWCGIQKERKTKK